MSGGSGTPGRTRTAGRRGWRVLLAGLLLVASPVSLALSVAPLKLELTADQAVAALTVRNPGDVEQVFQVTPMRWTQTAGESHYAPTEALLATPRLFRLAPAATQLVRVGFLDAPGEVREEQAYRVYFDEVPPPDRPAAGLQVRLRIGVPVFLTPAPVRDALAWRLAAEGGRERLQLINRGNRHLRLDRWQLTDVQGRLVAETRDRHYLLAGQDRAWTLPGSIPPLAWPLTLRAETGRGNLQLRLGAGQTAGP